MATRVLAGLPHLRLAAALRPHNLLRLAAAQRRQDVKGLQRSAARHSREAGPQRPSARPAASA